MLPRSLLSIVRDPITELFEDSAVGFQDVAARLYAMARHYLDEGWDSRKEASESQRAAALASSRARRLLDIA